MADTNTESIELTKGEAREIINALSKYQYKVGGRDEDRALNVREFLQREFGFEKETVETDSNLVDAFSEIFDDTAGKHEIQLSQAEAAEVVSALTDLETDSNPEEAETITTLQSRFRETFDLDAVDST